jgi:Zn-dependent protease
VADFLLILPVLLFSVVVHEFAHAWTAHREGDDTALLLGRLTLNPLPHIDPFMSVLLPVLLWWGSHGQFTFGAARPVPVNPAKFRHYRRGDVIVSSAGIVANLLLALAAAGLFMLLGLAGQAAPHLDFLGTLQRMAGYGLTINLLLAFFNLVPIPPLDGSHLLVHALPPVWAERYRRFGRYGFLALMVSLWLLPGVWSTLLWPVDALTGLARTALGPWALPTIQ